MSEAHPTYPLLCLPAPLETVESELPFSLRGVPSQATQYLSAWWRTRGALARSAVQWQSSALSPAVSRFMLRQQALKVERDALASSAAWRKSFGTLMHYVGSRAVVDGAGFVPTWYLNRGATLLWYEAHGRCASVVGRDMKHSSPSLPFEGVMVAYARVAAAYNAAVLYFLEWANDGYAAQMLMAASAAMRRATLALRELIDEVLPLHACVLDGTESHFFSAHFYELVLLNLLGCFTCIIEAAYVRRHVPARHTDATVPALYAKAYLCAEALRTEVPLYAAAAERLQAFIGHRRKAALISLAAFLLDESRNVRVFYEDGAPCATGSRGDSAVHVEAYWCALLAVSLDSESVQAAALLERARANLRTFSAAVPPDAASASVRLVVYEIDERVQPRIECRHSRPRRENPVLDAALERTFVFYLDANN